MKYNMKKFAALMLTVAMSATLFSGVSLAEEKKWTETTTKDGWVKIEQEGGKTLGYSPDSGVTILEADGYAFKDLNKNGTLDVYEDWRQDVEARASDLVAQMSIDDKLPLMLLAEYDLDYSKGKIDSCLTELDAGLKALCTPFSLGKISYAVSYNNAIQAYSEKMAFGIPVEICAETNADIATQYPNNLALAATFDPEITAEYARIMSKEYRTIGISGMMTPQTDLATEPRWSRITGTFGEDPQLSADIVTAFVNGLQSSYDADGNDLGWGDDSIITQVKHYPGDGAAEGGREAHSANGKYNVYPGDNFYTQLIPFKAALSLPGKTGAAVGVMPSYSIAIDADGEPYDDEAVASGFSKFKLTDVLRGELGFDGVISSDFVITLSGGENGIGGRVWGVENLTVAERKLLSIEAGMDRFGGESDVAGMKEAYQLGVEKNGQEAMDARIDQSVFRILRNVFRVGLFENAYCDTDEAEATVNTDESKAVAAEAFQKGVVLLKNSDNLIRQANTEEKTTVYIPMTYTAASTSMYGATAAAWALPVDLAVASKYFDVVTDKVADTLTGPNDADGNPTVAYEDIVRASDEEIAACAYALVFASSPNSSGYDSETGEYIPISLQYGEYTADGEHVRKQSLAGDKVEVKIESPYGAQTVEETENRSYYGKTAQVTNAKDLDNILYAAGRCDKVIVSMTLSKPMVFSEFEDKADAIVINFVGGGFGSSSSTTSIEAVLNVISGKVEPSGLLPLQMPANMDTVEAQYEDVPRDMECYVDANGNTYDFAFGMNWSGVINDERVTKYNVAPLSE